MWEETQKQPQITLHVCRIILQRKLEKLSAKKVSRQREIVATV